MQLIGVPVPTTWSGTLVSAAPAPDGIAAVPAGLPGTGCLAVTRVIDRARCRNPAVSARVIECVGQNLWLAQLIATPAATRRLIELANDVLAWTSLKWPPLEAVSLRPRLR